MAYQDQWNALSARIRGLMEAGHLHARFLAVNSSDPYGVAKRLREQIQQALSDLMIFKNYFAQSLPPPALDSIDNFVPGTQTLLSDIGGGPEANEKRVWAALVFLGAFETEISFILSDVQQGIRARSERAFSHLQRLIVADLEFRNKWQTAFDEGEVACEKLGAVHLLLHGIWAFKAHAQGARTDLVYQEPVEPQFDEQQYADGLVLTEWKKANSEREAERRFEEARNQARQYAIGALAGIELTGYRYAVVVSGRQVSVPDDRIDDGVVYRHINVAVDPLTPSQM